MNEPSYFLYYLPYLIITYSFFLYLFLKGKKFFINIFLKKKDVKKWNKPKLPLGGIILFVGFLSGFLIFFILEEHKFKQSYLFLFAAIFISFIIGIIDDIKGIPAKVKFFFQLIISCLVFFAVFENFNLLIFLLIVLSMTGIINSTNMIDNMDGICTFVLIPVISAIILGMIIMKSFGGFPAIISIIIFSFLIFFVPFTINPAKVYLGDSGTHILGTTLSFLILNLLSPLIVYDAKDLFQVVTLLGTLFYYPFLDLIVVAINRIIHKKPFYIGGTDHTSHMLYFFFHSETLVMISLFLFQNLFSLLFLYLFKNHQSTLLFSLIFIALSILGILVLIIHKKKYKLLIGESKISQ